MTHSLEWGAFESIYKQKMAKFNKYLAMNDRDLKSLKHNSFKEDNYDQIENFVEYEQFLQRSYFQRASSLLSKMHTLMKGSIVNSDFSKDMYGNILDNLTQESQSFDITQTVRT